MKRQINQRRRLLLLATFATISLLGASTSAFAQSGPRSNRFAFDYLASSTNQNLLLIDKTIARGKSLDFLHKVNVNGGQDKAEYPKPDFSAMDEWYDVTKVEYHIFDRMLNYVVKPKVESRPYVFELRYVDEDGTVILETSACSANLWGAPADVPIKCGSLTPTETQMEKVKKVYVIRKKM